MSTIINNHNNTSTDGTNVLLQHISAMSDHVTRVRTVRPVTSKYVTMDTSELVRKVINDLGVAAQIRVLNSRSRKSTKHMVEIRLQRPLQLLGTECYPTVYVRNSYAGEGSLQVTVGFHRLICTNGMTVGSVDFQERINHVGKRNQDKFTQLSNTIKRAIEFSCTRLEAIAEKANSKQATDAEIRLLLGSISASQGLSKRIKDAMQYVRPEDLTGPVDYRGQPTLTLWGIWNIINEQIRKSGRSEMRLVERNDKLANAVMQLAA